MQNSIRNLKDTIKKLGLYSTFLISLMLVQNLQSYGQKIGNNGSVWTEENTKMSINLDVYANNLIKNNQSHKHIKLFESLRKERRKGELRNVVYGPVLGYAFSNDRLTDSSIILLNILILGNANLVENSKTEIIKELSQNQYNFFCFKQLNKSLLVLMDLVDLDKQSADLDKQSADLDKQSADLDKQSADLDAIKKGLENILETFKKFNELFRNQQNKTN